MHIELQSCALSPHLNEDSDMNSLGFPQNAFALVDVPVSLIVPKSSRAKLNADGRSGQCFSFRTCS